MGGSDRTSTFWTGVALVIAGIAIIWLNPAHAEGNPLARPDQIALEQKAVRIFASRPVQAEIPFVTQTFAANPFGQTPEGKATLRDAVDEVVFAGVVDTIDRDPTRPHIEWLWSPAHAWYGINVPVSKVLMPNVDNVFRILPVDNLSRYRITAHPAGPVPTQFSVQLLPSLPAEESWSKVIQETVDSDIHKNADGSFVLTIGPDPAAGKPNHITTTPAAHFLLIRDTIEDWSRETPYRLDVERVGGPRPAAAVSEDVLARQAAGVVHTIAPRILEARGGGFANSPGFFHGPANQLSAPRIREGGRWGLSAAGHFQLADDEALVFTLDPIGGKYLAVQLANGWLGSLDYLHHTASLNLAQSRRNADGTVTFVVAAKDPGVANWLDTTGLHEGTLFVRWQKLPEPLAPKAEAVRDVRVVKLAALDPSLPRVTPAQRSTQLAARTAAYERRFAE